MSPPRKYWMGVSKPSTLFWKWVFSGRKHFLGKGKWVFSFEGVNLGKRTWRKGKYDLLGSVDFELHFLDGSRGKHSLNSYFLRGESGGRVDLEKGEIGSVGIYWFRASFAARGVNLERENLERGRIWGEGKCAWDYLFRFSHLYSPSVSSSVLNAAPASGLVRGIIRTKKQGIICAICCLRRV